MPNFENIANTDLLFHLKLAIAHFKAQLSPYFGKTDVAIDSTIVKF